MSAAVASRVMKDIAVSSSRSLSRCSAKSCAGLPGWRSSTRSNSKMSMALRAVAAGRLVDEPLEERFGGGGDLIERVAEEAAEGEGEAAAHGRAGLGRQLRAAVEEMAD